MARSHFSYGIAAILLGILLVFWTDNCLVLLRCALGVILSKITADIIDQL